MKRVIVCIGMILLCCYVQAQSIKMQLDSLLTSNDPADRETLHARLRSLAASDTESDMSIAASYYYQLKNMKAFDSIRAVEIIKFPRGLEARIKAQQAVTAMKSLPAMEKAYNAFIKDFPPKSYPQLPFGEDRLPYDRIRSKLADGYAQERNIRKAHHYAGLLEADFWKGKSYASLADTFYANGDLANAAFYRKKAVESTRPYAEGKMGKSVAADFAASRYPDACRAYAQILYERKNYSEALKYIETAIKAARVPGSLYSFTYAQILAALGRNQEAYSRMEAVVRSGKSNAEMWELFKALYVKVNGSDAGLDAYHTDLRKVVADDLRAKLAKMMINKPAADFTLTDLDGHVVKLSDLKGKVVILDFWATWCVPCKASFPAMQMAVNKYKDDPGVRFLFIHTWERTATPVEDVRTYIAGMKYSFQVLMDMKDPETKANKVVDSYNVVSIPTKFVIDGEGNIRFRVKGFDGSNEAAVDEVSMMIEMVRGKE